MDNACFPWRSLLRLHPFPLINSLCENPLQRCKSKHFTQCLLVYRNVLTSCFPTVSILGLSLCLAFLELSIFDFQIPYCYFFSAKASAILQMLPFENFFCPSPFCMSNLSTRCSVVSHFPIRKACLSTFLVSFH